MDFVDYEKFFRERLTQLRMAKDCSARDMSLSLGQSAGYINQIENGRAMPSLLVFFYVCDYFRITPSEFFDTGNPYPDHMKQAVKHLKKLRKETLAHVTALLEELAKAEQTY